MNTAVLCDLRYSLRSLRRSPGFALAAILTVALGLGATTAIYSVLNAAVLRPFPFPQSDRLVDLWTSLPQLAGRSLNGAANYRDWRATQSSFQDLALIRHVASFNLTGDGEPERVQGARVTASLFSVLGVSPLLGRTFDERAEAVGNENVVLLSSKLWRRRFGADPGIVGRSIQLSGTPYLVMGVMPEGFRYPQGTLPGLAPGGEFELWTPLTIDPDEYQTRIGFNYLCVGRLKVGVTIEAAQAEMNALAQRLAETYPMNKAYAPAVTLTPLNQDIVGPAKTPLYVLLGVVMTVLLIGCANLVNLLIARSIGRRQELLVRTALGAGRLELARQSLMDILPVMLAGGLVGIQLAVWIVALLRPVLPPEIPRVEDISIDAGVLAFVCAMMAFCTFLTALWPALQAARWNIADHLRGAARATSSGRTTSRTSDVLVIGQIAAVVVLISASLLLLRSFVSLKSVDPGFDARNVITMQLAIPRSKYPTDAQVAEFCAQIVESVRQISGVRFTGMVNRLPLAFGTQVGTLRVETRDGEKTIDNVDWRSATPEYFRAMGIPLLAGRLFVENDDAAHPNAGIIDDRIAKSVFGQENPIGRRFRIPFPGQAWIEIVGIVGHVHHDGLNVDPRGQVYWNYRQRAQDRMALVARVEGDPTSVAAAIVARVHAVDRDQPVSDVRPMRDVIDRSIAKQSLVATLVGVFAMLALVLAVVGVYGVMSYIAGQRMKEIGIRVALGASRGQIVRMMLWKAGFLVGIGLLLGVTGALLLRRTIESLLYEVRSNDLPSFAGALALVAAVALLACYLPARRAASTDPNVVLRIDPL